MNSLQSLDGLPRTNLGCGCNSSSSPATAQATSSAPAKEAAATPAKQYVSSNLMYQNGFLPTSDVLTNAGIPFSKAADNSINVNTPTGVKNLPTFTDITKTDDLVSQLTAPIDQAIDKVAPNASPDKKATAAKAVKVGLGLFGFAVVVKLIRSASSGTKSLSGPPAKRRLATVRM